MFYLYIKKKRLKIMANHNNPHHTSHVHHTTRTGTSSKKFLWGVLVILAIAIIIVLLVFFTGRGKIGGNEADPVDVQCAFFCESGQEEAFCNFEIQVDENLRATCDDLTKTVNAKYGVA